MQTQDSVISAMEKIKYYETLSKGGEGYVPDQKFRSKAYSPTPYGNLKSPTSVTKHTPPCLEGRATSADKNGSQNVERTVAPVQNTETQHVTNLTAGHTNGTAYVTNLTAGRTNGTAYVTNLTAGHTNGTAYVTNLTAGRTNGTAYVTNLKAGRTNGTAYDSNAKQKIRCIEGTVTETVAELKARRQVGKSSHIRNCMIPDNTVKAMPFESELAKETKHFNVQSGTIDVVKSTDKCLEMDKTNSLSKPGDCITKIYPDKTEHSYNEAALFECKTGTDYTQCKKKTVPRSKLPVKTTNQEIKAVLNDESKHIKSAQMELISVEKTRCTRDSANNLRANKLYEEHMEQKEKFETETERRQVEMENQLRSVCDILESIRAETEEIERIVENFADNVTACITILHESDNYESSEMNSDETNDRKFKRAYIKDEINEWLHQISEVKQNRIVSLIDLQRDMEEMNNFVKFLKQNNRKYTWEDISYKGRSFATEKTPLQMFETSVQTTKPFQNQKSSHISITEEQNRKGKGGGDFNLRTEGSASDSAMEIIELLRGSAYQKSINASLDLALGASLTAGEVSQKNNSHNKLVKHQKTLGLVKQRSVEELVSQSSLKERKSRIPKPTRQTYNNVSKDRKGFAHLEESSESGDYNRSLNSAKQIMQKHEIEIKRRATGESTTISDNSKKISTKNQRESTFYLKIKDIKSKIDTGLKTRSVGQTKVTQKDNLHSVHGRHTTKRKYESSRIPINSNSRIHY